MRGVLSEHPKEIAVLLKVAQGGSQLTQRPGGAGEERRGGSDVVEKPVAVANSGQWPSGVQRVHSGLVLLVVVVVSCSVARCGACCPAPLAPAE